MVVFPDGLNAQREMTMINDRARGPHVLKAIEDGRMSVKQGLKALRKGSVPKGFLRGEWLPLWLRINISRKGGRGFRLKIPLFIIGPLFMILILVLFPLLVVIIFVYGLKNKELSYKLLSLTLPAYALIGVVIFKSRGAIIEVRDENSEVFIALR